MGSSSWSSGLLAVVKCRYWGDAVPGARVSVLGWESLLTLMYEGWLSRAQEREGNVRPDGTCDSTRVDLDYHSASVTVNVAGCACTTLPNSRGSGHEAQRCRIATSYLNVARKITFLIDTLLPNNRRQRTTFVKFSSMSSISLKVLRKSSKISTRHGAKNQQCNDGSKNSAVVSES